MRALRIIWKRTRTTGCAEPAASLVLVWIATVSRSAAEREALPRFHGVHKALQQLPAIVAHGVVLVRAQIM